MAKVKARAKLIRPPRNQRQVEQQIEITGVVLIGLTTLAAFAVFTKGVGFLGVIIKNILLYLFGERGALIPIIFLGLAGVSLLQHRKIQLSRRFLMLALLALWFLLLLHLTNGVPVTDSNWALATSGSGIIGHFLVLFLGKIFGRIGMNILMLIWLVSVIILALDRPLVEVLHSIFGGIKFEFGSARNALAEEKTKTKTISKSKPYNSQPELAATTMEMPVIPHSKSAEKSSSARMVLQKILGEQEEKPKIKTMSKQEESFEIFKSVRVNGSYKLPEVTLIDGMSSRLKKNLRFCDQSVKLSETLANFGVQVKVLEIHHGPTITRYDLQPAPGIKVSKIVNLTDDLALALAAKGLRIEAPIPGKAAIGIEVPNQEVQTVSFRDMLEAKNFWSSNKLAVALGMDIAGEVVMADLAKMPHLLIAGATGSGKSVCVNTLIMSILYKAFPNEVKFLMIDPKMVELSMYNGIPHLMAPVVTEAKKAAGALNLVVQEMERRYKLFTEARVRDLQKYNAQLKEDEALPYIVVLVDELADLMMVAPVEVEDSICRLAQMARATGIHLVVATQRPSVDVITGLIKANIPSRIAFAVSSQIDSRTILDAMGAERLLGRGDMLFSPVGAMKPCRIQGALVVEKEIEAVIQHWKEQGEPSYQEQFLNIEEKVENQLEVQEDELFWDAVRIVVENGQASASVIQRRLRVGYTRAARLVDMMEAKGIVGAYEGSKPREVYLTARQMEEMRKRSKS